MTKQFLLYIEWTKILWKKELFGDVEASLSACTMKWVEVENDEGVGEEVEGGEWEREGEGRERGGK